MASAHQMVGQARAVKRTAEREREAKQTAQTEAEERLLDAREHLGLRQRHHVAIEAAIDWASKVAGDRLPDEAFWAQAHSDLQRSSPWLAESFQQARGVLFQAAFDLHRAFVDAAARQLRHNSGAALAVMQGRSLSEAPQLLPGVALGAR